MRALRVLWVASFVACSGTGPSGSGGGSAGGLGGTGGGLTGTGGGVSAGGGSIGGGATGGGSAVGGGASAGGSTAGGSTAGGSTSGGSAVGGGSTAGGSTSGGSAVGGGSTAGGSTSGGSAVGGGSTGGGSGVGLFTLDAIDFDEARVVVDGAGITHLAFTAFSYSSAPQAQQFYGRCAGNCTSGASWSFLTLGTYGDFGGSTQLVVGPNNSLHMLFTRESFSGSAIVYARCTGANCATAGAWSTVEIPLAPGYRMPRDSKLLAVDSNGVPAFIYQTSPSNVFYVRCSMPDCLQASSWLEANVQNGGDRFDFQYQGTTAYLGYLDYDSGTGGYATCASNCFNGPSWSRVEPFYAGRGSGHDSVAMGLGPGGAVHLVFNQGVTGSAVPQAHKQFDNQLRYWSCASNCLTATNWTGLAFAGDQGLYGVDLAMLPGGGIAFATSNINTTQTWQCGANCQSPGTVWNTQVVDTLNALQAFRPAAQSTPCGSSPAAASWYPSRGLKLAATGNQLKVLSGTKIIYQCSFGGQFASFGGVGRYAEVPY